MEEKIKMIRHFPIIFLLFFFIFSACASTEPISPTAVGSTVTPNPIASPSLTPFGPLENIPTSLPTAIASPDTITLAPTLTQIPQSVFLPSLYTLDAVLDYTDHSLSVDESIFYQNTTDEILFSLLLAVEPNIWGGCFILDRVKVNNQQVNKTSLAGNRLEISLDVPLVPGETLNLFLHFDLYLPPADSHHVFGYNERQTNLVDWYPFIVPYSNGWVLHPPADVGEHLMYDIATFDVTLALTDPTMPIILAASTPTESTTAGSWQYHLQSARTFALSASSAYQSASITTNNVILKSYYFKEDELEAQIVMDETAKALATFSELFGPIPYPSLSIVESPFFDGMEYDGLFFVSQNYYATYDGSVLNILIDIAVHETAHQWWFGSIGNDQALAPWLDEALATYSEELFYEKNYPDISGWWFFRVNSFEPTGWVDTDIYGGVNFRTYANAVYLRGAEFLEALRRRMGDEAFFAFLKEYARQMAGKRASVTDFFRILLEYSSTDISNLLAEYFQHQY